MALSVNNQAHFSTIANVITQMDNVIQSLFTKVILICSSLGLGGCRGVCCPWLQRNNTRSIVWYGAYLLKHQEEDSQGKIIINPVGQRKGIASFLMASRKIKQFCSKKEKCKGLKGKIVKSNITDNNRAKMLTSCGVIQATVIKSKCFSCN